MGRPAGSRNKPKRALLQLLQEQYPDYHPVLEMARIAHESDDEQMRFNAHKEVAKYVTPQLKAVEMTGNDGEPLRIGLVQFGSDGTDS